MVGSDGQDMSRAVPGHGKPHPDKAVPSPATSGMVPLAQGFFHERHSRVLGCEWQRDLCCREGNKTLLVGMIKPCHPFTFAVIMELFIKGCSSVFP